MPIHLPATTRRGFLATSISTAAGIDVLRLSSLVDAAEETKQRDPAHWILMADTHLSANRKDGKPQWNMFMDKNFIQTTREVVKLAKQAAGVIINGDCAYIDGVRGDYKLLAELLKPIRDAGLPVHLTMGNHDSRTRFWSVLANHRAEKPPLTSRHVSVVESGNANWFLLDSLETVNATPGLLGGKQRAWLAVELDTRKDQPAIIVLHHNLQMQKKKTDAKFSGLKDSDKLFEVLKPRKHVKAIFVGHTHTWMRHVVDGMHVVNLPPIGYVFRRNDPLGWVDARLQADGMKLVLHTLDKKNKASDEIVELKWRA